MKYKLYPTILWLIFLTGIEIFAQDNTIYIEDYDSFQQLSNYSQMDTLELHFSNYCSNDFPIEALKFNYSSIILDKVSNKVVMSFLDEIHKKELVKKMKLSGVYIDYDSIISKFNNLEELSINFSNSISDFNDILKLQNLKSLNLNETFIWEFEVLEFNKLSNLEELMLSKIGRKKINLKGLNELKILAIDDNPYLDYNEILDMISDYSKIEALSLMNNSLREIPSAIFRMSNLRELYLADNHIGIIPNDITKLINLKSIFFDNNDIETISYSINTLEKLRFMSIRFNKIKNLNFINDSNSSLKVIQISGNPIPEEVLKEFKTNDKHNRQIIN